MFVIRGDTSFHCGISQGKSPRAANVAFADGDISALIVGYPFSDGFRTFTQSNSVVHFARVSTDGAGAFERWVFDFRIPFLTPTAAGAPAYGVSTQFSSGTLSDSGSEVECTVFDGSICTVITQVARGYVVDSDPSDNPVWSSRVRPDPVPEPSTVVLLGMALAAGLARVRRRG